METVFDHEDFRRSEEAFRDSRSDSFIYILQGQEVWVEICMKREEKYYNWQCVTHNRALLDSWRAWFNHY